MIPSPPVPDFLAPISSAQFFAEYWGRAHLAIHRECPGYFTGQVGPDELDRLVTSVRIPASNFNLARGDTPLPLSSYCSGTFVDQHRALNLHQQGATVILRAIEQWSPPINRLRIAAEERFRCEAQINVYLTPAGEKSTPPHWDTHDLIVLQMLGSKRWRLYRGERTLPLDDERFQIGIDAVSHDFEEVVLQAGDTLYLPRGVIHEPVADSYSVHLSVGLHAARWYELIEVGLRLLAMREGSPLRRTLGNLDASAELTDVLAELTEPALLRAANAVLTDRFASSRARDLEGRLREVQRGPTLDANAQYVRRSGLVWRAEPIADGIRVSIGEQHIVVPPALQDAVAYVLTHDAFTPRELANGESGLALCVALQEIGGLRRLAPEVAE